MALRDNISMERRRCLRPERRSLLDTTEQSNLKVLIKLYGYQHLRTFYRHKQENGIGNPIRLHWYGNTRKSFIHKTIIELGNVYFVKDLQYYLLLL